MKGRVGDKDTRILIARIEAAGGVVERARGNHLTVRFRGRLVASLACTPSDQRTRRNDLAKLRRAGLAI